MSIDVEIAGEVEATQGAGSREAGARRVASPARSRRTRPVKASCLGTRRFWSVARDAPVVGYTGANGAGKTLLAVSEQLGPLHEGRPLYSTVPVMCTCGLHSDPILSLRHLLELRDCDILIDEVSVVFSSRETGSLPAEVSTFLQTMRHQGVRLRWTAPAWARADIQLREVTQVSVPVMALGRRRVAGKFWPTPILIGAAALDTTTVELDKVPEKVVFGTRRVYVPSRLPGFGAYDSEADVSRIGWARQGRVCVDCGGSKRAEPCSLERHAAMGIPV